MHVTSFLLRVQCSGLSVQERHFFSIVLEKSVATQNALLIWKGLVILLRTLNTEHCLEHYLKH